MLVHQRVPPPQFLWERERESQSLQGATFLAVLVLEDESTAAKELTDRGFEADAIIWNSCISACKKGSQGQLAAQLGKDP